MEKRAASIVVWLKNKKNYITLITNCTTIKPNFNSKIIILLFLYLLYANKTENAFSPPMLRKYGPNHDFWMVVYVWQCIDILFRKGLQRGQKRFCLASLAFILVVRVYVKDITLVYVSHKKDVKNEWNFFSYIPSSLCYIGVIKLWSFFFWCSTISFM